MPQLSRRGLFFGLLVAPLAAPAIIRLPGLLMPIRRAPNSLLTINLITKEAVRLWKNNNVFIGNLDEELARIKARMPEGYML